MEGAAPRAVLLRASKGEEDPYSLALTRAGFMVYFVAVLQFEFHSESELCSALLSSAGGYSGLIITSQNAVESTVHALSQTHQDWKHRVAEHWSRLPIFVVGKATAQAVERVLGLQPTGAVSGNAEALGYAILEHFAVEDRASLPPLLFPCGVLRRETLPAVLQAGGMPLKCLTCYDTVAHPKTKDSFLALANDKVLEPPCWVVWFSPSGVRFALEPLKSVCAIDKLQFAAIGPTTSEALQGAGLPVSAMASKPDAGTLVDAILE